MSGNATDDVRATRQRAWIAAQRAGVPWISPALRRFCFRCWLALPVLLLMLWAASLAVRLSVQDRDGWFLSYAFYATPPTVLTLMATGATFCSLVVRRRRRALVPLALALCSGIWAYTDAWRHNAPPPPAGPTLRVLFWNIAGGVTGLDRVTEVIRQAPADVVALAEALPPGPRRGLLGRAGTQALQAAADARAAYWRAALPGWYVHVDPSGIALLSRVPLAEPQPGMLGWDALTAFGRCVSTEVEVGGRAVKLLVVDVPNKRGRSRFVPLSHLYELLDQQPPDVPLLLMGDFNTPRDSAHLVPLQQRMQHAFDAAGRGYGATWPMPLPVLQIDHAWASPSLLLHRCTLGWSLLSDHRAVLVECSIR